MLDLLSKENKEFAVTYATLQIKMQDILGESEILVLYGDLAKDFKMAICLCEKI